MIAHLCGFYGHGNVGDEAMLAGITSWLSANGHQTVLHCAESPHHAEQMRNRYKLPVRRMNQRTEVEKADVFLIGGGDLGVGFGWNLLPSALHSGKRVAMIGMSFPHQWTGNNDSRAGGLNRAVLKSVDFVSSRDSAGVERLRKIGIQAHQGADPAFLLQPFQATRCSDLASVFLRHTPARWRDEQMALADTAISTLRRLGVDVILAGCAADDMEFCRRMDKKLVGVHSGVRIRETGFRWPRALEIVAKSSLVVSIGRYHPLVFAAIQRTPAMAIPLPCFHPPEKMAGFSHDIGIPVVERDPQDVAANIEAIWHARNPPDATWMCRRAEEMMALAVGESPTSKAQP